MKDVEQSKFEVNIQKVCQSDDNLDFIVSPIRLAEVYTAHGRSQYFFGIIFLI